jgi:DNA-directed RNA polymerase subunit RPC12/RpoP
MKCLPLVMTRGALLAQAIRDSYQDPRRHSLCSSCGSRMLIMPDRADQTVRCPGCARWQRVTVHEETPWRLSTASAEALRQTRSWLRRL